MSVIFEALRKVRHSEPSDFDAPSGEAPPANVYTIRGLLLSPQGLLGMALLIVLVGGIAYYGANYLESAAKPRVLSIASTGKPTEISDKSVSSQEVAGPDPAQVEGSVPPAPQEVTYQRPKPGKLYLPRRKAEENTQEHETSTHAVYLPPGQATHKEIEGRVPETKATVWGAGWRNETNSPSLPVGEPLSVIQSDLVTQVKSEPVAGKKRGSGGITRAARSITVSATNKKVRLLPEARLPVEKKVSKEDVEVHKLQEKQVKESGEKISLVTHLVTRLQAAMIRDDGKMVQDLLARLKRLKGPNDPFLLKAQAYWEMKKENYEKASRLLDTVLVQRPNDCEAGFNMAVIEINEGRIERARERLKALREMFPANVKISDLLREIDG